MLNIDINLWLNSNTAVSKLETTKWHNRASSTKAQQPSYLYLSTNFSNLYQSVNILSIIHIHTHIQYTFVVVPGWFSKASSQ